MQDKKLTEIIYLCAFINRAILIYAMKNHQGRITGILLAGGMSRRMGRDKAMIEVDGEYLYRFPLRVLEELCDRILISTCRDSGFPDIHDRICDEVEGAGPMGGLYTCLKKSQTDLNMVISCDLPMVNEELMKYLIRESAGYDIAIPAMSPDKPEPLCGIYRKNLVAPLLQSLQIGNFAVHSVFPQVRSRIIQIDASMPFYHPDLFLNINSTADLETFRQCKK